MPFDRHWVGAKSYITDCLTFNFDRVAVRRFQSCVWRKHFFCEFQLQFSQERPYSIQHYKWNQIQFSNLKKYHNHGVWSPFELHFAFSLKTSFGLFRPKTLNKPSVQNPSSDFHKKRSHFILSYNLNPKISNFKKYLKTWGLKPKG